MINSDVYVEVSNSIYGNVDTAVFYGISYETAHVAVYDGIYEPVRRSVQNEVHVAVCEVVTLGSINN